MGLDAKGLTAAYGRVEVVHGVDLAVGDGEIVAMLGRNGAGKSSTLLAMAGLGPRSTGRVELDGTELTGPAHRRARRGIGIVLEGRSVFPGLSVRRNIELGGADVDEVLGMFPELQARLGNRAGSLSGGEQQMLSLGRAICRGPRVLLLDEIDFGLAPVVSRRLFAQLRDVARNRGIGILLVEQHLHFAAEVADRALVMDQGHIRLELPATQLLARHDEVEHIYLGAALA
ncbi:MAG: ABC transporter [Pseudonocardia sp. SCN 72-86]|nr:MAG: ABC transporter [Pseudonocardia sp. SCN 72-86]